METAWVLNMWASMGRALWANQSVNSQNKSPRVLSLCEYNRRPVARGAEARKRVVGEEVREMGHADPLGPQRSLQECGVSF